MIHHHGVCFLLIALCVGIAVALAWQLRHDRNDGIRDRNDGICETIGEIAIRIVRSRDLGFPLDTALRLPLCCAPQRLDDYIDGMTKEIYGNRWDEATAHREIETRCLAKPPL